MASELISEDSDEPSDTAAGSTQAAAGASAAAAAGNAQGQLVRTIALHHTPLARAHGQSACAQGDGEFQIERLLEDRRSRRKTEYLVRWLGYGAADDTWEMSVADGGTLTPDIIAEYEQQQQARSPAAPRSSSSAPSHPAVVPRRDRSRRVTAMMRRRPRRRPSRPSRRRGRRGRRGRSGDELVVHVAHVVAGWRGVGRPHRADHARRQAPPPPVAQIVLASMHRRVRLTRQVRRLGRAGGSLTAHRL